MLGLALGLAAIASEARADGPPAPPSFELLDGDRVVFVGSALIERAQDHGYLETLLTARYPDRTILSRNLGWSGDTVFGEARAGFGTAADGFERLEEHVRGWKPTVAVVGYGEVESFDGASGLPRFRDGLDRLLGLFEDVGARLVILGPPRQEDLGRPLPDPSAHNTDVALYREALRDAARVRGARFVDLDALLFPDDRPAEPPLTDDGLIPNADGYWRLARAVASDLGLLTQEEGTVPLGDEAHGVRVAGAAGIGADFPRRVRFEAIRPRLPTPPRPAEEVGSAPPRRAGGDGLIVRVGDLVPGRFGLTIDRRPVATADAAAWADGVRLGRGPDFDQVEELRKTIIAKNELYFNRWRPENETYLFGFREKEQGQNAREVPLFDPLVAEAEAEIARLRVPVAHAYELAIEGDDSP